MSSAITPSLSIVLRDIQEERARQDAKHGKDAGGAGHTLPNGTSSETYETLRAAYTRMCEIALAEGQVTWLDIFFEEVYEAAAEDDDAALRKELIQVAAVCAAWVEDIDARSTS